MRTHSLKRDLWLSWTGVIVVLLIWQLTAVAGVANSRIFPGPVEAVQEAFATIPLTRLLGHIGISMLRIVWGFAIGAGLGIVVGIAAGWYRWLGTIVRAPIELIRPIPPLAWLPLALIWFGLGEGSKVFIIALGAFFPVVTNAYQGMANLDPQLLRAAQMLGVRHGRLLLKVALPASLPAIATGIRLGWSLSFGTMIAGEIIGANSGLGYMVMQARELGQIGVIIFGILLIGGLNLLTDYLIRELILRRQLKWHFGGMQNA